MSYGIRSILRHATKGPFGDSRRHLAREVLEERFAALPTPPADRGRLEFIAVRGDGSRRDSPDHLRLTPEDGVPGDLWKKDVPDLLDMQVAVMRADVARLIANEQALTLFGDQLFLDLDLSAENLPPGSRLRVGDAQLVVTPEPHDGCIKFRQRFGGDALRMVSDPKRRNLRLRGIYLQVVEAGAIKLGDAAEVLSRGSAT